MMTFIYMNNLIYALRLEKGRECVLISSDCYNKNTIDRWFKQQTFYFSQFEGLARPRSRFTETFPKASPPKTIRLRARVSTYEPWKGGRGWKGDIQTFSL